jgi:hypothetical protein
MFKDEMGWILIEGQNPSGDEARDTSSGEIDGQWSTGRSRATVLLINALIL